MSDVPILEAAKRFEGGGFEVTFVLSWQRRTSIVFSIASKRRVIRRVKRTRRVGVKRGHQTTATTTASLLSLSLSLSRRKVESPPKKTHLAKPVQVRDRLLHRRRRSADGIQAVRLKKGVARGRLVEKEESGHGGILIFVLEERRRLTSKEREMAKMLLSLSPCFGCFLLWKKRERKAVSRERFAPEELSAAKSGLEETRGPRGLVLL